MTNKPSEGTTPQAERKCNCTPILFEDGLRHHIDCAARAVAPVETPRITAKEFWPKYYKEAPNFPSSEAACDFAEAYYAYMSKMA